MRLRSRNRADLYGTDSSVRKRNATLRGAAAVSKISLAVATALAVAPPHSPAAEATDNSVLQAIVVTARKREENLQDVPLSIDVFTKKDMQDLGITGLDDILQKSPSISFISEGPGTQFFV